MIVVFVVFLVLIKKQQQPSPIESRSSLENKNSIIGQNKGIDVGTIQQIFPSRVIVTKDLVPTWIVGVPLIPFTSPLANVDDFKGELPNFYMYKRQYLSPLTNQGTCGACWAFASCFVLADVVSRNTNGVIIEPLSVQQVLECYKPDGCSGGSPEKLCQWIEDTGAQITIQEHNPYRSSGGTYSAKCKAVLPKWTTVGIMKGSVKSIAQFQPEDNYDQSIINDNVDRMKKVIISSGPIYAAITVYDDLFNFTGLDVYKRHRKATQVGGHAIEIIGFCNKGVDSRKGFESAYWICRHSWVDGWPLSSKLQGYFAIEMGTNMCGIESRCGQAQPILKTYITKKEQTAIDTKNDDLVWTDIKSYIASAN
jgi:hypothetical protein